MASDDASLEAAVVAFLFLMALKRAVRSARLSLKKKKQKRNNYYVQYIEYNKRGKK